MGKNSRPRRFSEENPTDGMPRHPSYAQMPIMWADEGDRWIFRKITDNLIPNAIVNHFGESWNEEEYRKSLGVPRNPMVRFACAAIHRAKSNGGGVDFVLWAEEEVLNDDNETSTVQLTPSYGPSHFSTQQEMLDTFTVIEQAFQIQYANPGWIDLFGSTTGIIREV